MLTSLTSAFRPRAEYDVAIVGAGPAGISLALTLAAKGRSVFLAEGGGLEFSEPSQDVYKGDVQGDIYQYLELIRLRYLGGTSGHWGGVCRPLDAQDFRPKPGCPDTGWPIGPSDLEPYGEAARRWLRIQGFAPDANLPNTQRLRQVSWTWTDPVRFGTAYRKALTDARGVDTVVNCNFMGFDVADGQVKSLRFKNWEGLGLTVKAKAAVLACGGIENSRLLLIENRRFRNALGNQGGAVGRWWTDHALFHCGDIVVFDRSRFHKDPFGTEIVWGPTPAVTQAAKALNAAVTIYPREISAQEMVRGVLCGAAPALSKELMRRLGRKELFCETGQVFVQWEQEPRFENRVDLDPKAHDAFGMPRTVLRFQKSELDRHTPRNAMMEVARYVATENIGRVRILPWLTKAGEPWPWNDKKSANHLMGGTRMGTSPAKAVVDADAKVFGTKNLYVAGSSIFPTGGFANPTYTIVLTALRLADRLDRELKGA